MKQFRQLTHRIAARETSDGQGVRLKRNLGARGFGSLDPFLMLDEIRSDDSADYLGGFPDHPHRGFETVTYMLEGRMRHRDHLGNEGVLEPGSVQWMSAAHGVVHSEMPEQTDGRLHGFQLWINLPAVDKMQPPRYQEFGAAELPGLATPDYSINLIAGQVEIGGVLLHSPVSDIATRPLMLDVSLSPGAALSVPVSANDTAIVYAFDGDINVGAPGQTLRLRNAHLGELGSGGEIRLEAGDSPARALVMAARPLHEPIAHWGPFVMNTDEEIQQAIADHRNGTLTTMRKTA